MKKTFLLTCFIALLGAEGLAYDVRVDGIYYALNKNTKEATVTSKQTLDDMDEKNSYRGIVCIPDSIMVDNEIYYVTAIRDAFRYCPDLAEVKIGRRVHTLERESIFEGTHLNSLLIPSNVKNIYGGAMGITNGSIDTLIFESLESMLDIKYEETYWEEGYLGGAYGFKHSLYINSEELKDVTIPEGTTEIHRFAFRNSGITSVTLPKGVVIYEEAFAECDNLTKVTIPEGAYLLRSAFYGCKSLKEVVIEEGMKSIWKGCFRDCSSLEKIHILGSLTSLPQDAFSGCTSLKDVYYNAENCPQANRSFLNTPIENATLHVPEDMIETFRATEPWSGFGQIVALQPGDMPDGVETIQEPMSSSHIGNVLYDLQGRRLTKRPERGMYIENGQVKIR